MSNSKNSKLPFERKNKKDGTPNPKYVDILEVDKPIAGQNFACLSFISPEKILKQRELYLFEKYIQQWDFTKSMTKFSDFLHFLSYKYNLKVEDVLSDFNDFSKEEEKRLKSVSVVDDFNTFMTSIPPQDIDMYLNCFQDKSFTVVDR